MVTDYLDRKFIYADVGIAFAYFNHPVSMSVADLLASLLQQLVRRKGILSPELRHVYQTHTESGTRPMIDTLSVLLQTESKDLPAVYIVLDALDEFTGTEHDKYCLLREIGKLGSVLRLLITSRPSPDIHRTVQNTFPDSTIMEIRANEGDIEKYVRQRLAEKEQFGSVSADQLESLQRMIVARAQGMALL